MIDNLTAAPGPRQPNHPLLPSPNITLLSYSLPLQDMAEFFAGCDIQGGKNAGIHFVINNSGKSNEAFVELLSEEDLETALACHKKFIKERYVDVTQCDRDTMDEALAGNLGNNLEHHLVSSWVCSCVSSWVFS